MRTIIIAEAGVNHNGSLETAKKLIEAASDAGADYIKFQTFSAEKVVLKNAGQAEYQKKNLGKDTSQYELLKKLELGKEDHRLIIGYCQSHSISFFSTAFDMDSIDFLISLNIPVWKVPSGEITNLPYLKKIGSLSKPVFLSTGMATLGEIEDSIEILENSGTNRDLITILHCTTEYPAPVEEVNLKAIVTIGDAFKVKIGYSDHTEGIEIPLAAVAMGACVIEKHLTLDKNMEGPDHKASIEPDEFKKMVDGIRKIERAMGNGIKRPSASEIKNKVIARKSIIASTLIKKGDLFTAGNLSTKRPGDGLSPMLWDTVIGSEARRDFQPDEQIEL